MSGAGAGAAGATAAAAAAAAIAKAIKASGTIVKVDPEEFIKILYKQKDPLVVYATGGFINTNYQYLMSYKGLAFFCKSSAPLQLGSGTEIIASEKIWIP